MNYCDYRKELLAVVYFTRHFKQYLLSSRFLLRTDNSSVSWLKKTPEPLGQNALWLEQLGEFTFTIQHRKGTSHANADAIHVTRASISRAVQPATQRRRLRSSQHAGHMSE